MGFPKVPLDEYFPSSYTTDIRRVIRQMVDVHKAKVRVIRVPHDDLAPAFSKACEGMYVPFMPTLCGYPVEFADPAEFTGASEVQVVCVQDDDTLLHADQRGAVHDVALIIGG